MLLNKAFLLPSLLRLVSALFQWQLSLLSLLFHFISKSSFCLHCTPDMQGGALESSDLGLQVRITGVTQAELQLCHRLLEACLEISSLGISQSIISLHTVLYGSPKSWGGRG